MNFKQIVEDVLSESFQRQRSDDNFSLGSINTNTGLYGVADTGTSSSVFVPSSNTSFASRPSIVTLSTGSQELSQSTSESGDSDMCDSKQNKKNKKSKNKKPVNYSL
jgi:hypothetical protein